MAFMKPEISEGLWYEVETDNGTEFIPEDLCCFAPPDADEILTEDSPDWEAYCNALRDYLEGEPQSVRLISGFGARLSAPGYLDRTDWCVFATKQEAADYLREEMGFDDESDVSNDDY